MSFFGSIYADPDLPHRARTVYMYLRDRAGGGSCWPGIKTIARDLHLSPRTVQRALNDLERAGYIQRQTQDVEELRRMVSVSGKPYAEAVCFIIDNYGIFEGCETYLMQLEDGRVYGELLRDIFPYLRRVELRLS